ncbi:MAG: DNA-3-methyladenine glycosylase [Salinivirgaceae bacterium]
MNNKSRLTPDFFLRDVLLVAPDLLGNRLVRRFPDGTIKQFTITEVEAYRGEEDLACHASKGRTNRTEVMYRSGGHIYVYLIYGMHFMLNFVTEKEGIPQAVLIRGIDEIKGPGRVSKILSIDKRHNQTSLFESEELWVEDTGIVAGYFTDVRVGIDYAGDYWKNRPWRFIMKTGLE